MAEQKSTNTAAVVSVITAIITSVGLITVALINLNNQNKFEFTINQEKENATAEAIQVKEEYEKKFDEEYSRGYGEGYNAGFEDGKNNNPPQFSLTEATEVTETDTPAEEKNFPDKTGLFSLEKQSDMRWNPNEGDGAPEDSSGNKYTDSQYLIHSGGNLPVDETASACYSINGRFTCIYGKFAAYKNMRPDVTAEIKIYINDIEHLQQENFKLVYQNTISRETRLAEFDIDFGYDVYWLKIEITKRGVILLDPVLYNY